MPTRLLNIPHRSQEEEAGCLAACAQMVLHHLGVDQSQTALNRLLGLTSIGTPYSNLRRLAEFHVTVTTRTGEEADLRSAIDRNQPVIAFVMTDDLPYWLDTASHAIVIVGYDERSVLLNDPAFSAPQSVAWDDFILAWSEHDFVYALIT